MKSQMMTLFKELQQAQSKLDEAEGMKKNLRDRLNLSSALPNSKMWNPGVPVASLTCFPLFPPPHLQMPGFGG